MSSAPLSISIALEFECSLDGSENLSIEFGNDTITDISGNSLQEKFVEEQLKPFIYLSEEEVAQAQSVGASGAGATYVSILINVGVSTAIQTSLKQMWNLLNMLQLITYISLLSVRVPPNLSLVLEYFHFSRG